uniref:Uncharacterized protein n=1 Tax=Steinernema glaseri TaxID=37863 RepID=A0A1I7ZNU7_9BILA
MMFQGCYLLDAIVENDAFTSSEGASLRSKVGGRSLEEAGRPFLPMDKEGGSGAALSRSQTLIVRMLLKLKSPFLQYKPRDPWIRSSLQPSPLVMQRPAFQAKYYQGMLLVGRARRTSAVIRPRIIEGCYLLDAIVWNDASACSEGTSLRSKVGGRSLEEARRPFLPMDKEGRSGAALSRSQPFESLLKSLHLQSHLLLAG